MKFTTTAAAVAVAALCAPALANPTHQFDQFFPGWDSLLQSIIQNNCTEQLAAYQTGTPDPLLPLSSLITPVIECILDEFPSYRMSEMASSAVILGLLPTILQALGSTAAETSLLALRRPVLSFLLVAGSPAVNAIKGSQFAEEVSQFVKGGGDTRRLVMPGLQFDHIPPALRPLIGAGEYLVVGAAVANVVELAYRLGVHGIVVFAPETIFMVPMWTFLAVMVHLGGVAALHMRVRVRDAKGIERRGTGFSRHVPDELVPSAFQSPKRLEWRTESVWFYGTTWVLGVGTVVHTVLGTLILSSLLFFSVIDAVLVAARYMASCIVCRAVLRFELMGMSQATKYQEAEDELEDEHDEEHALTQGHALRDLPPKKVGFGQYRSEEVRE